MTLLPRHLLEQLAFTFGLVLPGRLSEREVTAVLAKWITLRASGCRATDCGMPHNESHEEPGWLLWCATVASKVEHCPAVRLVMRGRATIVLAAGEAPAPGDVDMWTRPAVEVVASIEAEIRQVTNELDGMRSAARRGDRRQAATIASYAAPLAEAKAVCGRVRDSAEYRDGIELLRASLGACRDTDEAFRKMLPRVVRDVYGFQREEGR